LKRPTLPISRPLLDWLRTDSKWTEHSIALRALLAWRAHWGSINAGLSAQQPASKGAIPLLFIAGPWRSGSTVMHELLSAALGWSTPLTWQCMDPCAFQLQRAPRLNTIVARPMDGLQLGPLSPQEDEFALLGLGIDSAYRGFWQPHRLGELAHTLDFAFWQSDMRWLDTWECFARAVQGNAPGGLLIKSPNHSFRLPAYLDRFPEAKVVWMLRDAREVFLSNRKMWTQMAAQHGLGPVDPGVLDAFLVRAITHLADMLEALPNRLSPSQWAICRQPELLKRPRDVVEALLKKLALDGHGAPSAFEAALAEVRTGRIDHYPEQALDGAVQTAIERLDAAQALAFRTQPAT